MESNPVATEAIVMIGDATCMTHLKAHMCTHTHFTYNHTCTYITNDMVTWTMCYAIISVTAPLATDYIPQKQAVGI